MKRIFTLATHRCRDLMSGPKLKGKGLLKTGMAIAMMMLAPFSMNGQTTTLDFGQAGTAAWQHVNGVPNNWANINMSSTNYSAITNAKVGDNINWNYGGTSTLDISRIAFAVNQNGVNNSTNGFDGSNGFYLRREKINSVSIAGLYTGDYSKIAVLNLKPGDKVTFNATASNEKINNQNVAEYGVGIKYCKDYTDNVWAHVGSGDNMKFANGDQYPNTNTIIIDSPGDLMVQVNKGVYVTSIVIVDGPRAKYDISTVDNTTTFQFKEDGSLDVNDYTVPYMQVSFGSINDYLVVSDLKAEMHKIPSWSETLETGGQNYQPSAGSFYKFKPTAGGVITMEGSLTGRVHLFVYDPKKSDGGAWVQKQNNVFYKLSFPDFNNANSNTGEAWYDSDYSFKNENGKATFSFSVSKDLVYYVCINNQSEEERDGNYAFHLQKFSFTPTFHIPQYAKFIDMNDVQGESISLVKVEGAGSAHVKVKRVSGNFTQMYLASLNSLRLDQYGWLTIPKPVFEAGKDNAGTIIFTIDSPNGDATFVVTFPYHASFDVTGDGKNPNRTYGHTWNFMDPRLSDSNIGNCREWDGYAEYKPVGTTSGILSLGQCKNTNSQFYYETNNREWTYSQRQTGMAGGFHDPYYANVWDMEGDNADMIWETEGLRFDTGTNLSCIYNEKDAARYYKKVNGQNEYVDPTQPMDFTYLDEDPDRYVGLLPDPNGKSSFTIPCLKDGDRVLIFMKSGEATGTNGIFLKVHGALDAEGTPINENDLYKAGGTNWIHSRYEGCYHFIKNGDGDMKFDMVGGSMCKLLYIRIYKGKRIDTNDIVSTKYIDNGDGTTTSDSGHLLFINDKGATKGDYSTLSEHYSGKGQNAEFRVLTYSGTLNDDSFKGENFKIGGAYNNLLDFKSKVGEMGVFRLRVKDLTYTYTNDANQNKNYVADLCDRNFTVGYRDKVDYPYTWDFTDVNVFSNSGNNKKIEYEATKYKETTKKYENTGWDISLFDKNGNMKVNSGVDPSAENQIFSADKAGFGNQLWAGDGVIAEMRGLWFYTDDNDPRYNDCLQITDDGLRLANTPDSDDDPANNTQRKAWWNYKMVVPSVPANAAVYLRMKRDDTVPTEAKSHSNIDNADVYFLASRFNFGVASAAVKTNLPITTDRKNQADYSCFKVPGTEDEWIVAIKNTTGKEDHLTFTLNGWILEKVAVSLDPKTLNVKGYASESRKRIIDHSLTEYFTAEPVKAYMVKNYDKAKHVIGLDEVKSPMPAATDNGDAVGTVLHKTDAEYADNNGEVKILNNEFHLFVPDMHDTDRQDCNGNLMLSFNAGGTGTAYLPATTADGYTNFVLNWQYYRLDSNGNIVSGSTKYDYGEEAFFRIGKNANSGQGAAMKPNSAYIKIKDSDVAGAKISFIFDDIDDIDDGTPTEIVDIESTNADSEVYHTLSGVRVHRPTGSGLYIKNGKKVYVK